jgi:ABC-type sulfate/molybdate transport systems ATPase subunit
MALEMIASGDPLTEADYQTLLDHCMQDAGLVQMPEVPRPKLEFPQSLSEGPVGRLRLERLFNLQNVNALPPGQELVFGEQLTLIYGENGSGKTGYARPLGCAAFARGDRDVLPNATEPPDPKLIPQADFEVSERGSKKIVRWTRGQRCNELSGFYVFDGASVSAHLTRSNAINFSPADLSLLTILVEVTDQVRFRFRLLLDQRDVSNSFSSLFSGMSTVVAQIQNLGADTDLKAMEKLSALSVDEEKRALELQGRIAQLSTHDIPKRIAALRQDASDLRSLLRSLGSCEHALGTNAVAETRTLIDGFEKARHDAQEFGVEQFNFAAFSQIGTEVWREFVAAAKSLADAESKSGYPAAGNHCLLCRQPLSAEAVDLIRKLWDFLASDATTRLEAAQLARMRKVRDLENVTLSYFADDSASRRILNDAMPDLSAAVSQEIAGYSARRGELTSFLRATKLGELTALVCADRTKIAKVISQREGEADELEKEDVQKKIQGLEKELRELQHRRILAEHLPAIKTYVETKRWIAAGRQGMGSTHHVTTQYNKMFEEFVTSRYAELFQVNLGRLNPNLKVTPEMHGQKGEKVRQIVLNREAFPAQYPVDRILSEGEKRAVALADFLTEAALDENCTGLILDDPVTSFDFSVREIVARQLAEMAKTRQVIVFTHDLAFLYHVKAQAHELSVGKVAHWIQRRADGPGLVFLDNSPVCEKDFKKPVKAREYYERAKKAPPTMQEELLKQGFGALRTTYEAFVMYTLFNEVVVRWNERVSLERLREVRVSVELLTHLADRHAALSRYFEGHSHSDDFAGQKPTVDTLAEEIRLFEDVQKELKLLQQGVATVLKQDSATGASPTRVASLRKDETGAADIAKIESDNRLANQLRTRN